MRRFRLAQFLPCISLPPFAPATERLTVFLHRQGVSIQEEDRGKKEKEQEQERSLPFLFWFDLSLPDVPFNPKAKKHEDEKKQTTRIQPKSQILDVWKFGFLVLFS